MSSAENLMVVCQDLNNRRRIRDGSERSGHRQVVRVCTSSSSRRGREREQGPARTAAVLFARNNRRPNMADNEALRCKTEPLLPLSKNHGHGHHAT
jgi:hypothetical protein